MHITFYWNSHPYYIKNSNSLPYFYIFFAMANKETKNNNKENNKILGQKRIPAIINLIISFHIR